MSERAVCYDLHHTILDRELNLRAGVDGLLAKLQHTGTANVLTTTGGGPHLQEVFLNTGIRDYFEEVFEGPQIDVGMGKLYEPAAQGLGITSSDAPNKMVVTGDLESDQPADIDNLVFVQDPSGYKHDASLLERILQQLWSSGRGSFIEGFERIEKRQNTPFKRRLFDSEEIGVGTRLDGDIFVTLSFQDPTEGGKKLPRFTPGIIVPTLRVVSAKRYVVGKTPTRKVRMFG